ncbi:MAG: 3-phosphoshikimate 1-carboxyvinyltransferase [Myxococcota bacterium]
MKPTLELSAPASKSMTQRALVLAALAGGPGRIRGPLDCDDARYLSELIRALGGAVHQGDATWQVIPPPRPLVPPAAAVFLGNAGTAVRFGACWSLLLGSGSLRLDGDAHMRRRPLGPLVDALAHLGVDAAYDATPGCPPVALTAPDRKGSPEATLALDGSLSSQYASGLMMVAPLLPRGLELRLTGAVVSRPYLDMTRAMMRRAGGPEPTWSDPGHGPTLTVPPSGPYPATEHTVEPDWSGAAFLLAGGLIAGRDVTVPGLLPPADSLQGDAAFGAMMTRLRAAQTGDPPLSFDLTDAPDLIAPLTAAAVFAPCPVVIEGAAHTRIKESDRVAVLATQLSRLGFVIATRDDGLRIEPTSPKARLRSTSDVPVTLDPDHDHRMAMAFGLVGLRVPLRVAHPECVSKSFPTFWSQLETLRAAMPPDAVSSG